MTGMSATTGRALTEREHLAQSIADILMTPLNTRVMRRDYGSLLPDLIDWPLNGQTKLQAYAAVVMALMRWEPRIRLSAVSLSLGERPGQAVLDLDGERVDSNERLNLRIPLQMGAMA
jgi:phage baseplate assembly protein W